MSPGRSAFTSERASREAVPRALAAALSLALAACAAEPVPARRPHAHGHGHEHAGAPGVAVDTALLEVTRIHGGHGPWAVLGYRMGRYALEKLGLERYDFDLEITHASPREVQYSCIADGASAATGASVGKLNLALVDAPASRVETRFRRRSTGATVVLRPTAVFVERYRDVPRAALGDRGREVLLLPEHQVFEEVTRP